MKSENTILSTNLAILIDQFTKETVSLHEGVIEYDNLAKHAMVISDIRELSENNYRSTVVIFEPSISVIVTPEILEEFKTKFDLTVFCVYQNEDVVRCVLPYVIGIKADYSTISLTFIYSIVNQDLAILEPYQKSLKSIDSFSAVLNRIPEDMADYLNRFRGSYLELVAKVDDIVQENISLREVTSVQEKLGKQSIEGLTEMRELLDKMQDKVHSYEALLSQSYDKVFGGFYLERPKVLLVKRISHLAGIDVLLSVLYAVITNQYKQSCKVIKLVDSSSALDMRYIPNNYVPVTDSYNTSEVLTNNFLCKLGSYAVMFDVLMMNRSGLNYLIIEDCRGTMNLPLDETLRDLTLYEMSGDYATLLEYSNILSDSKKYSDFVWTYQEIAKYTGSRVTKLVNHPTVIQILDLLL